SPSVAVAVAKDGRILFEEAIGLANQEKLIPATPYTMYALASISKPLTATGLMVLVDRGQVDLDRPANAYLGTAKLTGLAGNADGATRAEPHRWSPSALKLLLRRSRILAAADGRDHRALWKPRIPSWTGLRVLESGLRNHQPPHRTSLRQIVRGIHANRGLRAAGADANVDRHSKRARRVRRRTV